MTTQMLACVFRVEPAKITVLSHVFVCATSKTFLALVTLSITRVDTLPRMRKSKLPALPVVPARPTFRIPPVMLPVPETW